MRGDGGKIARSQVPDTRRTVSIDNPSPKTVGWPFLSRPPKNRGRSFGSPIAMVRCWISPLFNRGYARLVSTLPSQGLIRRLEIKTQMREQLGLGISGIERCRVDCKGTWTTHGLAGLAIPLSRYAGEDPDDEWWGGVLRQRPLWNLPGQGNFWYDAIEVEHSDVGIVKGKVIDGPAVQIGDVVALIWKESSCALGWTFSRRRTRTSKREAVGLFRSRVESCT